MEKYSKFIFMTTPKPAPSAAPSAAPSVTGRLSARQKKAADLEKKRKAKIAKLKSTTAKASTEKGKVLKGWTETDPKISKKTKLSPKYEAFRYFRDQDYQKYVYTMLALIENHWKHDKVQSFDKAIEVWNKIKKEYFSGSYSWKKEKAAYKKLRAFFSKENVNEKLGFYYGKKIRSKSWVRKYHKQLKVKAGWIIRADIRKSPYVKTEYIKGKWQYVVTGWWTYDTGEGSYDEFTFATSINGAIPEIKSELADKKNYDSGIDQGDAAKIVTTLEDADKYPKPIKGTLQKELFAHFTKKPKKGKDYSVAYKMRWSLIESSEFLTKLSLIYSGIDFTQYKLRYFPKQNRVVFIRLNSAPKDDAKFGGIIELKDGRVSENFTMLGKAAFKTALTKEVLDKLSVDEVKSNLRQHEVEHSPAPSRDSKLAVSKDMLARVYKRNKSKKNLKSIKYNELSTKFYPELEELLKKELLKSGKATNDTDAIDYATLRIEELKKVIKAKVTGTLKEELDEKPETIVSIGIVSDDTVTIKPRDSKSLNARIAKLKKAAGAGLDTASRTKDAIAAKYKQIMAGSGMLGSIIGSLGSMIGIDVKADIKEFFKTGKKSMILGILMGASGVGLSRRLINATPIDSLSKLQQLAKKNGGRLTSQHRIKSAQQLKGLKITIPKGKGIIPGGKFKVKVKGIAGKQDVSPAKARAVAAAKEKAGGKKKGGMFSGIFSKITTMISGIFGEKGKKTGTGPMFETAEITVEPKTTLPPGTYIPKGAKISVA